MSFVAYSTRTSLSEIKDMSILEFDTWYVALVETHNRLTPTSEKNG